VARRLGSDMTVSFPRGCGAMVPGDRVPQRLGHLLAHSILSIGKRAVFVTRYRVATLVTPARDSVTGGPATSISVRSPAAGGVCCRQG